MTRMPSRLLCIRTKAVPRFGERSGTADAAQELHKNYKGRIELQKGALPDHGLARKPFDARIRMSMLLEGKALTHDPGLA